SHASSPSKPSHKMAVFLRGEKPGLSSFSTRSEEPKNVSNGRDRFDSAGCTGNGSSARAPVGISRQEPVNERCLLNSTAHLLSGIHHRGRHRRSRWTHLRSRDSALHATSHAGVLAEAGGAGGHGRRANCFLAVYAASKQVLAPKHQPWRFWR